MVQTKSRHHKNENTFRFQTLAERLSNISVDVTKRINRYTTKPEETETYFYQALEKWVDLNYSAVFYDFTIRVKRNCQTLAQLIYHKENLIETLKEFILKADQLSLQPILDLTAQLARDLQHDFYPYFADIFQCITKLLDTQDTEILELSFQTLSFLFKFLWRYMLKDLDNVYSLYSPLFDESRKAYIRNFAAESFAFLMRKMTDKNEVFDFLFNRLVDHQEELNGIGRLIFEMFRGIKHQFNACTEQCFNVLLTKLNFFRDNESSNELVFQCISKTVESMADYTKKDHTKANIEKCANDKQKLIFLMKLIEMFLKNKNCYLIDNLDLLIENLTKITSLDLDPADCELNLKFTESLMDLGELLLSSENVKFSIEKVNVLPNKLYQTKFDFKPICNLTKSLFEHDLFETAILPNVINYFDHHAALNTDYGKNYEKIFFRLITDYLIARKKIIDSESSLSFKNEANEDSESKELEQINIYEQHIKKKHLTYLSRVFGEKKFLNSTLNTNLINYLTNEFNTLLKSDSIDNKSSMTFIQAFLACPILLQNKSLFDLFEKSSQYLIVKINNELTSLLENFDEKGLEINQSLETASFLLSLNIWSLSMYKENNQYFSDSTDKDLSIKSFSDLISKLNQLKSKIKETNLINYDFVTFDKFSNHLLRSFKYFLIAASLLNDKVTIDLTPIESILEYLKSELSSAYHENRLNSLIILNYYDKSFKKIDESIEKNEEGNLFETCLKAEQTPASLDDYRQKIYYLQRLDPVMCSKYFNNSPNQTQDVPLRYFFGVLFENFKLLWDPLVTLIESYANHMKMNEFWNIFWDYFVGLTHKIESKMVALDKQAFKDEDKLSSDSEENQQYRNLMESLSSLRFDDNQNIDYLNNRVLLCRAMQTFASICESRTKVLVPLFFRFMNNEYYLEENRLLSTSYEDITRKYKNAANQKTPKEKYFNKALLNKHLCAFLQIFSKFTSPKSWHQEENLRNLYLNLLCHHDSNVQKSALSCLSTYQYEYLKPYKEHLEKLLEGKYFRHELVIFSLDESSGVIHNDHRVKLLPVLMRLLYGRFHSHETTHTSSRDTKSNKRSTIIQFLSSCNEYELNYFFNLIFDCLNIIIQENTTGGQAADRFEFNDNHLDSQQRSDSLFNLITKLNDVSSEKSIFDLKKIVPLKKILGILQSLDIILKKLARQMENFSHRILNMLCFIQKYSQTLFELAQNSSKHKVEDYHTNLLKVVRQQVTLRFKQFFDTFDHLNFNQQEYFLLFDSFIWPQSIKMPMESLKSINNLLKIFYSWSENSKYYPLFVVKLKNFTSIDSQFVSSLQTLNSKSNKKVCLIDYFKDKNILDILFELIDSPKCAPAVIDYVFDIIHNLVSFADFKDQIDDDTNTVKLPFSLEDVTDEFKSDKSDLNFGTIILKPYVTSIVNHIEKIVSVNMSKKVLPAKPLKVLARLSSFDSNSQQQCERIILLLIPYLIKNRTQAEESEMNILNSLNHLIKQVRNIDDFICPISRLFSVIKNRQSRVELCNVFVSIKQMDARYETIAKLVHDLNSWDPKRIEEPDYMLRLDAFKLLNSIVQEWASFDIRLASVLIYNCFFFINNVEDLAIKESSTNSINLLLKKSSKLELIKAEKNLFETSFVSEIKNGLRNKMESARHEFVCVLVEFLKSFKDLIPAYKDLHVLFDAEDIEKDFFENIKHIQMHRRSRALKRLQRACNDNLISSENLLSFMMPLIRSFLDNEMYHKYDYIIEEACVSIGSICYVLDWPKYIKIVEYYLKILPKNILNQKLVIKILVNVLDAFHYDLSLSNQKDYFTEKKESNEDQDANDEYSLADKSSTVSKEVVPIRRKKLVGSAMANKIHATITKSIIPMLFKCLTKRLSSENEHKVNKREDEDEQILRVPMALAILKLLNNLPRRTLETHLPGLLFKVCDMLKSRAMSVRNTTRDCLMKMIETLPDKRYYLYVFKELSNALLRGYQVHVLCFTIQMVLKNVQSKLVVGDLDSSLGVLMSSVNLELFSETSEEKEVKQIVSKVMEAKTVSSFSTLQLISKYVSQTHLLDLLKPFKEQLDDCNSRKLLKKIEEALRFILLGLLDNTSLTTENLMFLVYGLVNDTFDAFKNPSNKRSKKFRNSENPINFDADALKNENSKMPESCLLIAVEPKRGGDKPKVLAKTNQHVIVEFALQLMHSLMKQNRLVDTQQEKKYTPMLDPYLPMFVEYLDGKYLKVTIITLRCLMGFLKYPLPSLESHCKSIANKLFALLRTYSGSSSSSESSRGDNFELLMVCYKVIATLIRDVSQFNLNDEQLQVLLHYAERNLYDNLKQASAFNLLKSILSRKLVCEELTDVLGKVMKLSIQADSANVRLQSRQTMLQYMLEYSLPEKKLSKLLEFYIVQLNYEYENGRESALEMLATLFNTFPTAKLNENATLFYLPLAIQLHNDESPKCKKLAWLALKSLIEKISIEQRDSLFAITMSLFKDNEKPLHKRIAALLIKIFVEVETQQFERRLDSVLEILMQELDTESLNKTIEANTSSLITEKFYDQYLYNLLSLFMKILYECKLFNDKKYTEMLNKFFDQVKIYLTHEHLWVRLISCQLFGLLFSSYSIDDLINDKSSYFNYSTENFYLKIRDLIDAFCVQLKSPILDHELAEQIVKNLAFLTKLINRNEFEDAGKIETLKHDINIQWLIYKVGKEAKYELVNKPKETIKRTYIFKWLAALALELGKEKLKDYLHLIIPYLQREMAIGQTDENLKRLAHEVLDFIKQTIGIEEYSLIYSKSNKKRMENKEERKRKIAQLAVIDPQMAAAKKIRKMQRKKDAKKRKMTSGKDTAKGSKKEEQT